MSLPASAEWWVQPVVSTSMRVNDNRQLEKRPETRFFSVSDIDTPFQYISPEFSLTADPKVRISRYTGSRMLDSDDVFFNLNGQRNLENGAYGLQFGYERVTTLTTELADSGVVDVNVPRTSFNVSPYWSWQLNERTNLRLSGAFNDVSYEQLVNSGFTDYRVFSAGPELTYNLTEKLQLFTAANLSRFEVSTSGDTTESLAIQGGAFYAASETLKGRAIFGWNFSDLTFSTPVLTFVNGRFVVIQQEQQASSDGDIVTVELEKIWGSRLTSKVNWNRRFSPSSQGSRQFREEVQGRAQYLLSARSTLSTQVGYSDQSQESQLVKGIGVFGVQQIVVEAGWHYALTQDFALEAGYRRLMQTVETNGSSGNYNEIFLSLNYNGNSLRYP